MSTTKKYREAHKEQIKEYRKNYLASHREEHLKGRREYYQRNKERINARRRARRGAKPRERMSTEERSARRRQVYRERRQAVFDRYGGSCRCCGETRFEFLALDHIEGSGHQHKLQVGRGESFVRWIIKNDYPENIRVLCHNCNQALGHYGYCPHQIPQPTILAP